ncbi:uncharacterized protein LOC127248386 [Andrographis paniculata]|uniref:uncharacterized protein LOC127248386 n=1 Tax=Andrographis paniculata TaxID=175694 RepID=UPI0021E97DFE|nr:uncharacterized protein LOC127248386 [Andrographis paniculata]
MSRNYDNWERLVAATLDRQKLRDLALASSADTSFTSSVPPCFDSSFTFKFRSSSRNHVSGMPYFRSAIRLADDAVRVCENPTSFKPQCSQIKIKALKVAQLLRQAMLADHELYDRPARRVMESTETVLKRAISLVLRCRGLKRVFTAIAPSSFPNISSLLEHSIANIRWLLSDGQYHGVPPIAADEPVLCDIWVLIAILHTGSAEDRSNAVASLLSLAHQSDVYRKLIVEEGGGVEPFLRLVLEGTPKSQANAVMVITLLGKEHRWVIDDMVSTAFVSILREAPLIKLQGTVAWAVSELAEILVDYERYNFVHLLSHLAFKTLPEDRKVYLARATRSDSSGDERGASMSCNCDQTLEMSDLATDDYIKVMATRALWRLAIANMWNCRIITESKALTCFAFFLEKGPKEARYNSAMALTEITAEAEQNTELRRLAFKLNLPAYKAVVYQLLKVIDHAESANLIPCVKILGNLARTFKATETARMITSLVKLLDAKEATVVKEVCVALAKFVCSDNKLRWYHSKAIVDAGGENLLVRLVRGGTQTAAVRRSALTLLCHVASNLMCDEAVVLTTLRWALKQASLVQFDDVDRRLPGMMLH